MLSARQREGIRGPQRRKKSSRLCEQKRAGTMSRERCLEQLGEHEQVLGVQKGVSGLAVKRVV